MVYFSNMMRWFYFPEIYPVSGFFPDISGFLLNFQISSQNEWVTSHIWYDEFLFRKFIRFLDFFPDFPDFPDFSIILKLSLKNGCIPSHLWYDDFLFWKYFEVPDFFRIFFKILIIFSHSFFYYSLLCSRSRTLSI